MKNFKSIAERNAEFASMTKMEKRVALAKDVLAQMELKKFIPTSGTYISSFGGFDDANGGAPIIRETCDVCALGALTLSLIDGEAINDYGNTKVNCHSVLQKYGLWSIGESREIENAFEGGYWFKDGAPVEHLDADYKMSEIMLNIIRNEGEFKGDELPFYY